jgi:hypothetical protein
MLVVGRHMELRKEERQSLNLEPVNLFLKKNRILFPHIKEKKISVAEIEISVLL